ncbi:MAG: glycosyltransferase [Omnitrophica bacterium]|nr:glycosyltransferase [Candidatus Omnitrophota bacterium]
MTGYPKITVIIPAYNSAKTIRRSVKSVLVSNYPDFEIIVVDDASTDDSAEAVSDLACKTIALDKNSGPGVARNRGVEYASGEIVAFVDADCEVPGDWLGKIADDFKNHDIGATSGGYSKSGSSNFIALFQFYDTRFMQRNIPQYINSCITSNFAARTKIFKETGGFPSKRINEDMEFGLVLSKKHKILWNRDNGVLHNFDDSPGRYFKKQIIWAESATGLYFSDPSSIFKKHTYNNAEILSHLLFTGLLYVSPAALFRNLFPAIVPLLILFYFIMNARFIRFVAKEKKYIFALKTFSFLYVRNTAWLLGITRAIFRHPTKNLSKVKI